MVPTLFLLTNMLFGPGQKATPIREPGFVATAIPVREEAGRYTSAARDAGIRGTVTVAVMVETDGSPGRMRIVHGLGYGLDQSALIAVRLGVSSRASSMGNQYSQNSLLACLSIRL